MEPSQLEAARRLRAVIRQAQIDLARTEPSRPKCPIIQTVVVLLVAVIMGFLIQMGQGMAAAGMATAGIAATGNSATLDHKYPVTRRQ